MLLAAACTRPTLPPEPRLTGIEPAVIPPGAPAEVTVHGDHFFKRLRLELDAPGRSRTLGTFTAALTGPERVTLQGVTVEGEQTLRATVPAIAQVGTYALELTDPWGRTTRLQDAFNVAEECVTTAECADDGLSCTAARCERTRCVHAPAAGFCVIDGACVTEGALQTPGGCSVCRSLVSATTWSSAVNGTSCDDGDACSLGESCQAGVCGEPTAQVTCPAAAPADPCVESSRCEPATGACVVAAREGACDDGYACTSADACVAGECRGTPACGNTPPRACFTVHSSAETSPATFVVDARCTHDLESPDAELLVRFGVDGVWQAADALGGPVTLTVEQPGAHVLQLEVTDPGGRVAHAEHHVLVATTAETLVVTTPAPERDPGATPSAPGGTGFSFEEAVAYGNPDGGAGLPAVIRFRAPMEVRPGAPVALLTPQLRVGGREGLVVDFGALAAAPCLRLGASDQQLVGLRLAGCGGTLVTLSGDGARLLDVTVSGSTGVGIDVDAHQCRLGPGLVVEQSGDFGVRVRGFEGIEIIGARVRGSATNGIEVDAQARATVVRSEILFNGGAGISLVKQNSSARLWNNTVHGNFGDGILARQQGAVAPTLDVRNNLLTANAFGICGQPGRFSAVFPNGASGNARGASCPELDAGTVDLEPRYLAPDAADFRLLDTSAAIDAGVDLGVDQPDLNGPAPGRYSGPAPDLGAHEVLD